ncbi:MAG: hypothetical protein RIR41_2410 [Pseudomonadota bacterium]
MHAHRALPVLFVLLLSCLGLPGCGGGGSDAAPSPTPLFGSLHIGGRERLDFRGEPVRAIASDGTVVAETTLRGNGQFILDASLFAEFAGHVEIGLDVETAKGTQTVHLSRDLDMAQHKDGLPLVWVGPVSTLASRYRRAHPGTSVLAAEELAKQLLGIPLDMDAHSGLGDSHRSPFSWSMLLAEFGDSSTATLDEHIDDIVADMGTGALRNYRKPRPYAALHAALYGEGATGTTAGVAAKGGAGFWTKQLEELPNDLHYSLDAKTLAPAVGWLLQQAGILPSPPSNAELLQELEQIQETIAEMQAEAVSDKYQIAWQNSEATVGPACLRIDSYTQQLTTYLSGKAPSPALAALAMREYAAASTGMQNDFYTLSDMLVGRNTPNGPLVSILAANMMLEKYGIEEPTKESLFLPLRTNEALDELRQKQDYYLGYLMLSMNLLMEWAHLDPFTFPLDSAIDANIQAQNLETVRQIQTGQPNAFPVGSRPGYGADIAAAMQLVPPATLGHDMIMADMTGTGVPVRPNYWYMNCWWVGRYWGNASNAQAAFQLGPWPAGSFRCAWVDEVLQLRQKALTAVPGDVRAGLRKLGWAGVPNTPSDFYVWSPLSDGTYVDGSGEHYDAWLVNMDDGSTKRQNNGADSYKDDAWALFVRYAPSGTSQLNTSTTNQFPPTYSYSDDIGTAVVCRDPQSLGLAAGPLAFPPDVEATYPTSDNLRVSPGTQTIREIQRFGAAAEDAYTMRSRLVWRPDYANGAQGFVVSNAGDDSTIPFLQLTNANPIGNLIGELYTGYQGAAASFGNRRANPVSVTIPVGFLAGQQATVLSAPPIAAPMLTSVMAVPSNHVFTDPAQTAVRCYATGFYADSLGQPLLVKDHSVSGGGATVAWSVTSPSGLASFSTLVPNLLLLDPAQGSEQLTIVVTVTVNGATKTDRQACWTKF